MNLLKIAQKALIFCCILFVSSVFGQKTPMVMLRVEGVWHVFDTNGKLMWEPSGLSFQSPAGFMNGYFCARQPIDISQKLDLKWGYALVKPDGTHFWNLDATFPYGILSTDEKGFIVCENVETMQRFVTDTSSVLRTPLHTELVYLGNGLAAFPTETETEEGRTSETNIEFQLFDVIKNQKIATFQAYSVGEMHDEMIEFMDADQNIGFLNKKGDIVIPPQYSVNVFNTDETEHFENGHIFLRKDNLLYRFDKTGKEIYSRAFRSSDSYKLGKGFLQLGQAIVGPDGEMLPIECEGMSRINDNGVFVVHQKEKTTLMDINGKKIKDFTNQNANIAPPDYFVTPNFIWIKKQENEWEVIDAQGKTVKTVKNCELPTQQRYGKVVFQTPDKVQTHGRAAASIHVATESGQILTKKPLTMEISLEKNYFLHTRKDETGDNCFDFYNYKGQLILDNPMGILKGDYIIPISEITFFNRF